MDRLIVIAVSVFLGIYLLARWYDKGQASPNEDAVVSKGASEVLILVPASVAILLFVLILSHLIISFVNIFQTMFNF